jgi:hypothetical protein
MDIDEMVSAFALIAQTRRQESGRRCLMKLPGTGRYRSGFGTLLRSTTVEG